MDVLRMAITLIKQSVTAGTEASQVGNYVVWLSECASMNCTCTCNNINDGCPYPPSLCVPLFSVHPFFGETPFSMCTLLSFVPCVPPLCPFLLCAHLSLCVSDSDPVPSGLCSWD